MSPSNRSKTRKAEISKSQKTTKYIDFEVKNVKAPVIVLPPRTINNTTGVTISPKCMLSTFGIKPAQRKEHTNNQDTKLKCCVIETPGENAIIFRFETYDKKQAVGAKNYYMMT